MKYYIFLLIGIVSCACGQQAVSITPSDYLDQKEQNEFKYSIIRYIDRLPKKATEQTKFDGEFDQEYQNRADHAELLYYYLDKKTGETYFAISKIAPSLTLKKVVTAGKLKKDANGTIIDYEEEFRTWKIDQAELKIVSEMLFNKYITGGDLSPFYTRNANGKFIIEFPDENVSYNKEKRVWISKLDDPLKDYYKLKHPAPTSDNE